MTVFSKIAIEAEQLLAKLAHLEKAGARLLGSAAEIPCFLEDGQLL
jgi:hypothetical protein